MAQTFDQFYSDPSTQGLLGLSLGLLSAGGASRTPINLGQALGMGGLQGMQSIQQAKHQQLLAQQIQGLQYSNQRAGIQAQLLGQAVNNQGAIPTPQGPAMSPTQALAMGAQQGSIGPTNANAALMGAYNQPSPSLAPVNTPAAPMTPPMAPPVSPMGQTPPVAPPSAPVSPPMQAQPQGAYFNPEQLFRQGQLYTAAGLPGGAEMMSLAVQHDPSIAQKVAMAQKGYSQNPDGSLTLAPGFAAGQGQIAGAEAQAKLPSEVTAQAARGAFRPLVLSPTQRAISSFATLPPALQQTVTSAFSGQSPQAGTPGQTATPAGAGTGAVLTPLQAASQTDRAAQLEKFGESLTGNAQNAIKDNTIIDNMKAQMGSFEPGKFAPQKNEIGSYLLQLPGMQKAFPGMKDEVSAWQEFEKNSVMLSSSAARTMGAREPGSVIAMFKNAYPNASLTDQTLGAMFAQIHGMNDYHIATQSAADQWRNAPQNPEKGTLAGFQSYANKTIDPQMFVYRQMPPAAQQAYAKSLTPAQRQAFAAKIQAGLQSGLLPPSP